MNLQRDGINTEHSNVSFRQSCAVVGAPLLRRSSNRTRGS